MPAAQSRRTRHFLRIYYLLYTEQKNLSRKCPENKVESAELFDVKPGAWIGDAAAFAACIFTQLENNVHLL